MGSGKWDEDTYKSSRSTRAASGTPDFDYTTKHGGKVHKNLDPKRINDKPFRKLESRDSKEHPESNAVFVSFDVTGSNYIRAVDAQQKLPNLMNLLERYLTDPQVLIAANDDYFVEPVLCTQISDFESDIRIDEHIRNIVLVNNGGGNNQESYDHILYAAAFKTVLDCLEKRNRKGYFFMYADEPIPTHVSAKEITKIFGDSVQGTLSIRAVIDKLREQYHAFVIWPTGGYQDARAQYVELFGEDHVLTLQHPNMICELIGSIIGLNEGKVAPGRLTTDLVAAGISPTDAREVLKALPASAR